LFRRLSLALSNFFLFPKIKIKFKRRRFDTAEEIHAETQTTLNTIRRKYFQDAFRKRQKDWDRLCAPKATTLKAMMQNKNRVGSNSVINIFKELLDRIMFSSFCPVSEKVKMKALSLQAN
jgi:hypothetical protein